MAFSFSNSCIAFLNSSKSRHGVNTKIAPQSGRMHRYAGFFGSPTGPTTRCPPTHGFALMSGHPQSFFSGDDIELLVLQQIQRCWLQTGVFLHFDNPPVAGNGQTVSGSCHVNQFVVELSTNRVDGVSLQFNFAGIPSFYGPNGSVRCPVWLCNQSMNPKNRMTMMAMKATTRTQLGFGESIAS